MKQKTLKLNRIEADGLLDTLSRAYRIMSLRPGGDDLKANLRHVYAALAERYAQVGFDTEGLRSKPKRKPEIIYNTRRRRSRDWQNYEG